MLLPNHTFLLLFLTEITTILNFMLIIPLLLSIFCHLCIPKQPVVWLCLFLNKAKELEYLWFWTCQSLLMGWLSVISVPSPTCSLETSKARALAAWGQSSDQRCRCQLLGGKAHCGPMYMEIIKEWSGYRRSLLYLLTTIVS